MNENIIEILTKKYNLAPDSYYSKNPYDIPGGQPDNFKDFLMEKNLQEKWSNHIPPKWYGFSLGSPLPTDWFYAIDEFLEYVKSVHPDFQILQIKTKWGGLRCYLENISPETQGLVYDLENLLSDKFLIY